MKKKLAAHAVPEPVEPPITPIQRVIYTIYLLLSATAAFLGAQFIGPSVVAFLALSFGVKGPQVVDLLEKNTYVHFALILLVEALTIAGVSFLIRRRGWKWADIGIAKKPGREDLKRGLITYVIYFVIFIAVYAVEVASHLIKTDQPQQLGFDGTHGIQLVFVLISLVILPPIAEEILFRGYIFMGLRKKLSFIQSALITSLLFAVAHLEFGSGTSLNWAAAIDTFTLSCVLTYATEKSKSIWPNMIVHTLKNLLAFILLFVVK